MGSFLPLIDGFDPVCIVGISCRLPGEVMHPDALWGILGNDHRKATSASPPQSREFASYMSGHSMPDLKGQWLGTAGLEAFDASFFNIRSTDAVTLRPNIRLGLELTHSALESSGTPPSSLRGKNVAVIIGVGTEDGWDMKRWKDSGSSAFDHNWAASSDPSGIAGHISHFFDFCGISNTVSNACASGAFALHDGVLALQRGNADIVIVGAIATHFTPAAFVWANSTKVASASGRSSAFSPDADGYSPAEGAVFFVLKTLNAARKSGDAVHGIIRGISLGHNGSTRSLITPSLKAQIEVSKRAMSTANVLPDDISLVEAHGTGTPVGDAIEVEGIRAVYGSRTGVPLVLSSSKTVLGHSHGAAALVGLLKVLTCFRHREVPPHQVTPLPEFLQGPIVVPITPMPLTADKLVAQVNAFGFTGSVSTIIVEGPLREDRLAPSVPNTDPVRVLLPFSTKSPTTLQGHIDNVCSWAIEHTCSIFELAAILSICRDHYDHRRAYIVTSLADLATIRSGHIPRLTDVSHDEVPLKFLNLDDTSPDTYKASSLDQREVDHLLKSGRLLEVARRLYENGHNLDFGTIYVKHAVNPELFLSFPSYPFERRVHWPAQRTPYSGSNAPSDKVPLTLNSPLLVQDGEKEIFDQSSFERLIADFGTSFDIISKDKPPRRGSLTYFLLTGANGMLGCLLLERLLQKESHHVYCIIRGDASTRLRQAFRRHNQDDRILESAISRGCLTLLSTSDLSHSKLGLSDTEYEALSGNVDEVVHAAWNVNFNLPLVEFLSILRCTRHLAELCIKAKKKARYNFIGSYAGTFNYPEDLVPERALEPKLSHCLAQGYAISKMIAEHSLLRIHGSHHADFSLAVIRVGQICGSTRTGDWSQNEMMPMMIASLPLLGAFPAVFPPVSWIPSDVCASALHEFLLSPPANREPQFIHLANPTIVPWREVAHAIAQISGVPTLQLISLEEYILLINRQRKPTPVSRLLPYLTSSLEKGTMPTRYASLHVSDTLKAIPTLAACPHMKSDFLMLIVGAILKNTRDAAPIHTDCIFLFGPWAPSERRGEGSTRTLAEQRLMENALRKQSEMGVSVLSPGSYLEQQLSVLAAQVSTAESLRNSGCKLVAVLGYCFGEYAAAISAGIISEDNAVSILVRRASAIQVAGVQGSMMNVFCGLSDVRRHLATLQAPPSVAIHAGPNHVVLSGSRSEIDAANELLRHDIKCLVTGGSLPFHSSLMDEPVRVFVAPDYAPQDSDITYISGVTSGQLPGRALKANYWLRHLREPIKFYQAVLYGHQRFPGATFIDIGPGNTLTNIIKRYDTHLTVSGPANNIPRDPTFDSSHSGNSTTKIPTITHERDVSPKLSDIALDLLRELFGYQPSTDMLQRSLHSLGLQSMDFIRFANHYEGSTGVKIPLSAYVSDLSLGSIIQA